MNIDIVHYIKQFLLQDPTLEAAIPGLGVFYVSEALETDNTCRKKTILFKEKAPRSKVFTNFMAFEENITEGAAIEVLEKWVVDILQKLKTTQTAEIPQIGTFKVVDNKAVFTPATDQGLEDDHWYGLDTPPPVVETAPENQAEHIQETHTQPVVEQPTTETSEATVYPDETKHPENDDVKQKKSSLKRFFIVFLIFLLIALLAAVICYFSIPSLKEEINNRFFQTSKNDLPSGEQNTIGNTDEFIPEDSLSNTQEQEPVDSSSMQPKHKMMDRQAVINSDYFVINGSFKEVSNAENYQAKMIANGYPDAVILYNSKTDFYLVCLGYFATKEEAVAYKNKLPVETWIFKK